MSSSRPHKENNHSASTQHVKTKNQLRGTAIMQSPPSPTPRTSSPLVLSHTPSSPATDSTLTINAASISSATLSSPPETPRGRLPGRYPADLGRVPLHRRGTSHTYERLEDLLREAGYKETRIFTPEGERGDDDDGRVGPAGEGISKARVRGGMGAVVGFLAGLVPEVLSRSVSLVRPETGRGESSNSAMPAYSPPPSPLLQRNQLPPSSSTSSYDIERRPATSVDLSPSLSRRSATPIAKRARTSPLTHNKPLSDSPISPFRAPHLYDEVSQAHAYIRHISSAPNIHGRPASVVSRGRASMVYDDDRITRRGQHEKTPPLPQTWLETVARAVLTGTVGSYIGGPAPSRSRPQLPLPRHSHQNAAESVCGRQPRSSASSQKADFRATSSRYLAPPSMWSALQPAQTSVSTTRVVCRSAPGSRSSSKVRASNALHLLGNWDSGPSRKQTQTNTRKRTAEDSGRVPSLAKTKAEGDGWDDERRRQRQHQSGRSHDHRRRRYLSGWGMDAHRDSSSSSSSSSGSSGDEDEEDGEIDLARILIPPKRQNSIRSLRRHLHASVSGTCACPDRAASGAGGPVRKRHVSARGDLEDEPWQRKWELRPGEDGEAEDDDRCGFEEFLQVGIRSKAGSMRSARSATTSKTRLPMSWTQLSGRS